MRIHQGDAITRRFVMFIVALFLMVAAQPSSGDARMQSIMRSKLANTQSMLKAIVTSMSSVDGLREAAQRRDMEAVGDEYSALGGLKAGR